MHFNNKFKLSRIRFNEETKYKNTLLKAGWNEFCETLNQRFPNLKHLRAPFGISNI
jgi:hypothetical protein